MTRIAEVENRGAVVAWSPIPGQADIIAIGAKVSLTRSYSFSPFRTIAMLALIVFKH